MLPAIDELRQLQRNGNLQSLVEILNQEYAVFAEPRQEVKTIFAIYFFLTQQSTQGNKLLKSIDVSQLKVPEALSDYGLACTLAQNFAAAQKYLLQAAQEPHVSSVTYARLGSLFIQLEQLERAEVFFEKALLIEPNQASFLNNLAWLKYLKLDLNQALELYNRVLEIQPDFEIAAQQRMAILLQQERIDELIQEQIEQIGANPENVEHYQRLAFIQNQAHLVDEASATLQLAIEKFPSNFVLKSVLIGMLFESHRWDEAELAIQEWLEVEPAQTYFKFRLIEIKIENRYLEEADKELQALSSEQLTAPDYSLLLARLRLEQNQYEEAIAILEETIQRFPGLVRAYLLIADALSSIGRSAESRAYVDKAFQLSPQVVLQTAKKNDYQVSESQLDLLEFQASNHLLLVRHRASVKFCLASIYEKRADYERSFATIIQANELLQPRLKYDYRQHRRFTEETIQYFSSQLIEQLLTSGHSDESPIFITGMPRSGTTLTEQILCSHPQVFGGGELQWIPRLTYIMPRIFEGMKYPQAMSKMNSVYLNHAAQYYLARVGMLEHTQPRFTDKLPHNFDYIGLIALMFPKAKIIHLNRDWRDIAVSNYYQDFGAAYGLMGFAFDLQDIGHMLNDHSRIMQHWHEVLPGRVFELDYERLIAEPTAIVAAILDYCELEWDDAVMNYYQTPRPVRTASVEQVRKNIYTSSVKKWHRYQRYLAPLEEVVAAGFEPLGVEESEQVEWQSKNGVA